MEASMSVTTDLRKCAACGAVLPADAPQGLCPRCVVQVGLSPTAGMTGTTPRGPGVCPPSPQDLAALFPQLEIIELLGHGGMGAVYKARQPGLDRFVALKVLPPISESPAFIERFTREARALARLS